MNKERIDQMDAFVTDYEKRLTEYVEKYGWNANEEFQAYLNLGWSTIERMVGCSCVPIEELRQRFLRLTNVSINACFDSLKPSNNSKDLN